MSPFGIQTPFTYPSGRRRPSKVYFAQCGPYVKVGCSSNPARRIRNLGHTLRPADMPSTPLALLAVIPGDLDRESRHLMNLHAAHAVGEWFHATPEVLSYIASIEAPAKEEAAS